MTEYVCKYTPLELLAGFGEECSLVNLAREDFKRADTRIHRNVCGFSRALIEGRMGRNTGPLLLTDCCDSIRRAGDTLRAEGQSVFLVNLPHKDDGCARRLFTHELLALIQDLTSYWGRDFRPDGFRAAFERRPELPADGPRVAILGARMSDELLQYIQRVSPLPVQNKTCTGTRSVGTPPQTDDLDELMDWYAGELLAQPPCMRMTDIGARRTLTEDPNIAGIIYNTVSFCDFYGLEHKQMTARISVPILKVETDYTKQASAQLANRLDAFFENLPARTGGKRAPAGERWSAGPRYFAGVDSGSTSTNAVLIDNNRRIVSFSVLPTGVRVVDSAEKALEATLRQAGIPKSRLAYTVTTGYGRASLGWGDRDVTEITCHATGAFFLNPHVRTVIDIGGQDSKVIRLDETGAVKDFVMNDKCAAGTGRFLEMMAQSLGITLGEMSSQGLAWDEDVKISSMCSVFAQSEVVSLIASGKKLEDIVHGLNLSVASKVVAMAGRTRLSREYMMTGGVAKNRGVVQAVEEKLGASVCLPPEPEICGALGAALIALDSVDR